MIWKRWVLAVLSVVILSGASYSVYTFTFTGHRWANGSVISLKINLGPGSRKLIDGRKSWDQVAVDSVNEWNRTVLKAVPVKFVAVRKAPGTKLQSDGRNSIFFANTVFGRAFNPGVGGVTLTSFTVPAMVAIESDIVMNAKARFNSYRGPQLPEILSVGSFPANRGPFDFRRILLHEIGHLLGLNHPDQARQRKTAIMNSVASATDRLQIDDINGVYQRYGKKICRVRVIRAGQVRNGNIANTDCVAPHRPGMKRADLYSFTATQGQVVTITMNRKTLGNPFLVLLGTNGGKLAQNNNGGAGVNARIKLTIPKTGKYTVEATTSTNTDRGTYALKLVVG